jgi:HEAT repeat protein
LQDEVPDVRVSAAEALGQLQAQTVTPILISLLQDEVPDVRVSAAEALGQLQAQTVTPILISLLQDEYPSVRSSAAKALGKINTKDAIILQLNALDEDYFYNVNLSRTSINFHLKYPYIKADFYSNFDSTFELLSDISGAELIDLTLRKLSSIENPAKALRAALKLKNNGYLNSTQLKIIDKALAQIAPALIKTAEQTIAEAKQQQAEEEKSRRPVNQPYPETKPLSLDELKAKLNQLDQDYAEWRKQRDTETPAKTTNEPAEDSEAKKLKHLEREVYLYNYAFAIAHMDQESGIELLKHNLFKVRQAAASGLVNSDQFKPQLLASLEQEWLATQDPISRQSLYHAIDTSLLVLEGIGGQAELDFLKAYQPKLTDSALLASIQPRVEWTIFQLQWRMDQVKDLEQLGKDQEPELLERYCLNPDGSDKKPEECTMRPY